VTTQRVLGELAVAFRAQIEPQLLARLEFVVSAVFQVAGALQRFVDFQQMIAILVGAVFLQRLQCRIDFDPHDVTLVLSRLKTPVAEIARIVNHDPIPKESVGAPHVLMRCVASWISS
jgi:hypothetical protein